MNDALKLQKIRDSLTNLQKLGLVKRSGKDSWEKVNQVSCESLLPNSSAKQYFQGLWCNTCKIVEVIYNPDNLEEKLLDLLRLHYHDGNSRCFPCFMSANGFWHRQE